MNYVCYELDEDPESSMNWYERILHGIAELFAPRVNPDFYASYRHVVYWWLELNQDSIPIRELGFDDDGRCIVAGPFGVNKGVFTHGRPRVKGFYPVEMYQFVQQWESFKEGH